jgi:hypothetical protein
MTTDYEMRGLLPSFQKVDDAWIGKSKQLLGLA